LEIYQTKYALNKLDSCLKLYEGKQIQALVESGLNVKPLAESLEDCLKIFEEL
jgi:hypothetical protein